MYGGPLQLTSVASKSYHTAEHMGTKEEACLAYRSLRYPGGGVAGWAGLHVCWLKYVAIVCLISSAPDPQSIIYRKYLKAQVLGITW